MACSCWWMGGVYIPLLVLMVFGDSSVINVLGLGGMMMVAERGGFLSCLSRLLLA